MDELVLKVRADTRGVRTDVKGVADETDNLRVSSQKASSAVRGFVNDLAQAKSGSDVASAALGAFAKILGTSIAGTAVVIAGKALIDAFNSVSESVKLAKNSVESAGREVERLGKITGFQDASQQANILYNAAEAVRKEIEKIEGSKLTNFISGLTGAREQMDELFASTKKQADELTRQGIVAESIEIQRSKGLSENDQKLVAIAEKYNKLIDAARKIGDQTLANNLILEQQGAVAEEAAKQKLDAEQKYQKELYRAEEEARILERKNSEDLAKFKKELLDSNREYEKKLQDNKYDSEKESERKMRDYRIEMYTQYVASAAENEKKLSKARDDLYKANLKLAGETLAAAFGPTEGKGAASIISPQALNRLDKITRDADRRNARMEIERVRGEMEASRDLARTSFAGRLTPLETAMLPKGEDVTTRDAINELRRRQKQQAEQGGVFSESLKARDEIAATEGTLSAVRDLLQENIDMLTNFSTAS